MKLLPGREAAASLNRLIHERTQVHDYSIDLTVKAIFEITECGSVDFGNSEYTLGRRDEIETYKRNPDDKYGWWDLARGCYLMHLNESVALHDDEIALVQSDERLLLCGAYVPSFFFRGPRQLLEALLVVGDQGIEIKENARVASLIIIKVGTGR